jgi:hypothetical protein
MSDMRSGASRTAEQSLRLKGAQLQRFSKADQRRIWRFANK